MHKTRLLIIFGVILLALGLVTAGLAAVNTTQQAVNSSDQGISSRNDQSFPNKNTLPFYQPAAYLNRSPSFPEGQGWEARSYDWQSMRTFPPQRDANLIDGFDPDLTSGLGLSPEGNMGDWDSNFTCCATVISDTGGYKMWFTGLDYYGNPRIGLAGSSDGINWSKSVFNPIFSGAEPFVLKIGPSDYRMWYSDWYQGTILYVTSTNGLDWSASPMTVLTPTGQTGSFERDFVNEPAVVVDGGGMYWMFYEAGNNEDDILQIGVVTSTNGIDWNRIQTTPVLPVGDPGTWEERWVLDPFVILNGSNWGMWYRGMNNNNDHAIGFAASSDGLTWTRNPFNPRLQANPGAWDDGGPAGPSVYFDGSSYQMWYYSNRQIGYATSPDGIVWTRPIDYPVLQPSPYLMLDVNYGHDWVGAFTTPNASVTVTLSDAGGVNPVVYGKADTWGNFYSWGWPWDPYNPGIQAGDSVEVSAVGLLEVVDPIGEIVGSLDIDADTIGGVIHAPQFVTVTVACEVWAENGQRIDVGSVDGDGGIYFCDFGGMYDIRPGTQVAVIYDEPDGDRVMNVFESPWMFVNLGHDWVGAVYPAGHTFWITVTNDLGEIKATAEAETYPGGGWGSDGFTTQWDQWFPENPDIEPGDWVYYQSDDGYYHELRIGDVQGDVDIDSDSVSGPIYVDWFTQTLNVECHPWGAPQGTPGKSSTAEPDGSVPYFCQWDPLTEWDMLPGQDVAVMYIEPDDNDRVINVFREPAPDLQVQKWTEGTSQVSPGGAVMFTIYYRNNGDATAESIRITDTLPVSTTYLMDTSSVVPDSGPGWVAWTLGPLEPNSEQAFQVVLLNNANVGDDLLNILDGYTLYDFNTGDNHAEAWAFVEEGNHQNLYVDKWPQPGDPTPGQTFLYPINYGNQDYISSGPVTLTETLPANTSLVSWQSEGGYEFWSEVSAGGGQLVLQAPTLPGYWGDRLLVRLLLDEGVAYGTQLTNTVEITTPADLDPWNDYDLDNSAWVKQPRLAAKVDKRFSSGSLVPGGYIDYHIYFGNEGNMAGQVWLTDTLPEGTTFADARVCGRHGCQPFPPDEVIDGEAIWNLGVVEPGAWLDFDVQLDIDDTVTPGTALTNCTKITLQADGFAPIDSQSCATETVNEFGPNLRLYKYGWWDWQGQLQYQLDIRNIGSTRLDESWLTDTYPLSTTWNGKWWGGGPGQITVTHNAEQRELIFWLENMCPGCNAWIGFQVDLDGGLIGQEGLAFTNYAEIPIPEDVNLEDNYAQVTHYTGPDVYIEKELSGGEPRPGEIITFTVEFGNANMWPWDGDPEYGSTLTDTLPTGMTFITATKPGDPANSWMPEILPGNVLRWGWGTMWNNNSWKFDLVVQLDDDLYGGEVLTNLIEAYGDSPYDIEYNYENNQFALPVTILGPAWELSKTYEGNAVAGTELTYTLALTNTGNDTGTAVRLVDYLPDGLTFSGTDGIWNGTWVTWVWDTLAAGESATGVFWGDLSCTAGVEVVNDEYWVDDNDQGITSTLGQPVSVVILAPTILAAIDSSSTSVLPEDLVTFTSVSTTDGTPLSYAWDFGDGATATGESVQHAFALPGSYTVTLTVTDECGYTEQAEVVVEVSYLRLFLPMTYK